MSAQSGQLNKIYVGDLPVNIQKEFLQEFFSEVGVVTHVEIRRSEKFGKESCSALIDFKDEESVRKAVEELNYTKFDGKAIRVAPFNPPKETSNGNLFIKNLDKEIEVSQLHEAFANFGEIVSCKIATDANGMSKGYGYVQFKFNEDAEAAMRDLKDASINGKAIEIQPYRRNRPASDDMFTNVFVKNLPESIDTHDKLKELFAEFGETLSCKLEFKDGKSACFGYCSMKDHESAVRAVQGLSGREMEGKRLWAGRAMSKSERMMDISRRSEAWRKENEAKYKGRNLYIKNFDEATEEQIREAFSVFGEIENMHIPKDEHGYNIGHGYVCYKNVEDAEKAILGSCSILLNDKPIYVQRHLSQKEREEKEKQKANANKPEFTPAFGVQQQPAVTFRTYKDLLIHDVQTNFGPKAPCMGRVKGLSEEQAYSLASDQELWKEWLEKYNSSKTVF